MRLFCLTTDGTGPQLEHDTLEPNSIDLKHQWRQHLCFKTGCPILVVEGHYPAYWPLRAKIGHAVEVPTENPLSPAVLWVQHPPGQWGVCPLCTPPLIEQLLLGGKNSESRPEFNAFNAATVRFPWSQWEGCCCQAVRLVATDSPHRDRTLPSLIKVS